jgi:hypothetical protein
MKYRYVKKLAILALIIFLAVLVIRHAAIQMKRASVGMDLRGEIVKTFSFPDDNSLKEWEEKIFKNRVSYKVEKDGDLSCVRAVSDKSASALYYRIELDARNKNPVITWKWRVEKFPVKTKTESLEIENEDDFAARVYVIFPALFITNSKVLEYIWSETLPVGTIGNSPYSKNIKLITLQRGMDKDKKWFTEERDIYSDYVKLFGRPPEHNIGAIAFMTNTEHTGTSADAMYADIQVGYKR